MITTKAVSGHLVWGPLLSSQETVPNGTAEVVQVQTWFHEITWSQGGNNVFCSSERANKANQEDARVRWPHTAVSNISYGTSSKTCKHQQSVHRANIIPELVHVLGEYKNRNTWMLRGDPLFMISRRIWVRLHLVDSSPSLYKHYRPNVSGVPRTAALKFALPYGHLEHTFLRINCQRYTEPTIIFKAEAVGGTFVGSRLFRVFCIISGQARIGLLWTMRHEMKFASLEDTKSHSWRMIGTAKKTEITDHIRGLDST